MKRLGTAAILLPATVLIVTLGCASHSPTAPLPENVTQVPTLLSAPIVTSYHVSGIVTDDDGSPAANAQITLCTTPTHSER